jgi:hypothetical protein
MPGPQIRGAIGALWNCYDPEVLLEGRAGTSKTTGVCYLLVERCRLFPGSRHLIVRQTRKSITESVAVTLERVLRERCPSALVGAGREHRHSYRVFNSEIVLGGLDDPERHFSTEWDSVYTAEAVETSFDAHEKFGRACRHFKMVTPWGEPFCQRILDCNPSYPGHWLNKKAHECRDRLRRVVDQNDYNRLQAYNMGGQHTDERRPIRRLVSVFQDNPYYWDMTAWDWTIHGRIFVEKTLAGMTGHNRARLYEGRWVAQEGTIFGADWDDTKNTVRPFDIPGEWPQYVFMDPGYDHPCAILWLAVGPNGTIYIVDEVYQGGLGVTQQATHIYRKAPGRNILGYFADPQDAFKSTMQAPKSIAQQFRELPRPINFEPWQRTGDDETSMIEAVRHEVQRGTLKVFDTCTATIDEFQSWKWQRDAKGEQKAGDDKPEDRNNHAMDCVKGAVSIAGRLRHGLQKIQVIRKGERVRG